MAGVTALIRYKLTKDKERRDARYKRACERAKNLPEEKRTEILRLLREVREQYG